MFIEYNSALPSRLDVKAIFPAPKSGIEVGVADGMGVSVGIDVAVGGSVGIGVSVGGMGVQVRVAVGGIGVKVNVGVTVAKGKVGVPGRAVFVFVGGSCDGSNVFVIGIHVGLGVMGPCVTTLPSVCKA